MMTAGIDCGARNTKAVLWKDGAVVGRAGVLTGWDPVEAVKESLNRALEAAGVRREHVERIAGTGYGKNAVRISEQTVDDIRAMGKGAWFFFPAARTVVDVGAEEGRAARLDEQGRPLDFAVNERCAAGAGDFIEAMSRVLKTPLEDMGPLALASDRDLPMNAQCAVFAEAEAVALLHANVEKKDISRAVHEAMAARIVSTIRRIGVNEAVVMIGGVARNRGVVEAVKRELGLGSLYIPEDPEYAAAAGAAVLAAEEG